MRREPDPQLEALARRQLTRLIDAIETTPPALVDVTLPLATPRPVELDEARARAAARRRRMLILASTAVATVAAVVLALVVVPGGSDGTDDVISDQLPRTSTSIVDTTAPDPGVDGQPPRQPDEECQLDLAEDGRVAVGQTPDGRLWEYRVDGRLPDVNAEILVDDTPAEGTQSAATRQDGPLSDDQLRHGRTEIVAGEVVESVEDVVVPATAQTVEVYIWDGAEHTRLQPCPMAIPGVADLKYAATFVPHGSEPIAAIAFDDAGQAVAYSENVSIPDDGGPPVISYAVRH